MQLCLGFLLILTLVGISTLVSNQAFKSPNTLASNGNVLVNLSKNSHCGEQL